MAHPIPDNLMLGQPTDYRALGMAPIFIGNSAWKFGYRTLNGAFDQSAEELISAKQSCVVNLTLWSRDADAALTRIRTNLHRGE